MTTHALPALLLLLPVVCWPLVVVARRWLGKRSAARAEIDLQAAQNADRQSAQIRKWQAENEERKWKILNEPTRVRRQLAADLLFPGLYTTEDAACKMRADGVYEWILTGTYTRNNPRHLLLNSKVKDLEAREKAESESE